MDIESTWPDAPQNRIEDQTVGKAHVRDLLILVCGASILFTVALGSRDLWNPNEPIYGQAVVEMSERGDWLIPTVNGSVFSEKPILYYWMALSASKITGNVNEVTLRIPSVAAGLLGIILTYFLVLPYTGRKRALLTGLMLGSMYGVFWCSGPCRWIFSSWLPPWARLCR